ncbi:MAG: DUF3604 domain-containing protein [Myxococcota bacterium]|nr:DUF3604 domain-containing protein [Myxococcota bacterium]
MKSATIAVLVLLTILTLAIWGLGRGLLGHSDSETLVPVKASRPIDLIEAQSSAQSEAARSVGAPEEGQIPFGDLHAHTTISFDAFMLNLPLMGGTGAAPPADACDFARHCAALDFWSINDHASNITEADWKNTIEAIRQCNARSGDPDNPDLVSFLGWEWTQAGGTPDTHYGHKNIVLRDFEESKVPTRPIAATAGGVASNPPPTLMRGALALTNPRFRDLASRWTALSEMEICADRPVRELSDACREIARTPTQLFEKLDDWGFESIVIPHGTAWGIYTPPRSTWDKQLQAAMHDPNRQTLIEVYSGHGDSEVYRDWRALDQDAEGRLVCPPPRDDYLPACWHAGRIIERRCLAEGQNAQTCAERAATARNHAAQAGVSPHVVVPGVTGAELTDSGQCRDCDQPAFKYRPGGSAQYIASIGNFEEDPANPRRFRMGFIASSDIHSARPGTGYKEKREISESPPRIRPQGGSIVGSFLSGEPEEPRSEPRTFAQAAETLTGLQLYESERVRSYLYSGGLVAVHAQGRDRQSIWNALQKRNVYGTSGPRILLYFDLITGDARYPMGSELQTSESPIFHVRAVGSLEQKEGCPETTIEALGAERTASLCAGECYQPGDSRRPITHIDVVRIRPQTRPEEDPADLIDDPWQRFECPDDTTGCTATFIDPDFPALGRDTVYYARAFEAPSPTVNGQKPECLREVDGECLEVDLCRDDGTCLSDYAHRAWSSPIFVDHVQAR